ncbi:MAG TPA: NAD(P)H-binding protein [Kribbellaceae bacterium]|nr:NAD(P)H-binding protein [Kribbellaceae bacterium]
MFNDRPPGEHVGGDLRGRETDHPPTGRRPRPTRRGLARPWPARRPRTSPYINRRLGRTVHEDMRRMEALISDSGLDWTIVRASGLFNHPQVTGYQIAEGSADGVFTARTDLAAALLE